MSSSRATMLAVLAIWALAQCDPASAQVDYAFIGEIRMFAGNFPPRGWAFCDGSLFPISPNTALFSILGTTYGGDGVINFRLPDLRGRVPVHAGFTGGPGLTPRSLGAAGGSETVTLVTSQVPSTSSGLTPHTHNVTLPLNASSPHQHSVTVPAVDAHTHNVMISGTGNSSHQHTVQVAAGATSHSHGATVPSWAVSHTHTADPHTHTVQISQVNFTKQTVYVPQAGNQHQRGLTAITIYKPSFTTITTTTSPADITLAPAQVSQPATPITTEAAPALAGGDLTLTTSSATVAVGGLTATTDPAGAQAAKPISTGFSTSDYLPGANQVTTGPAAADSGTPGGGGGSAQPHDNMPPFLAINYIIAIEGIFPVRN